MKNIAETIKEGREQLGLTQEEFAAKLFVTRQAVSGWERGKNLPDIEKLKQIADMLQLPLDTMLFNENENMRKSNSYYRYIAICFLIVLISLISIGVYQVFNPPHIIMMRDYEGVCPSDEVVVTYHENEKSYHIKTSENVVFDFGSYCVPLEFTVTINPDNYSVTRLHHGPFSLMGINLHNPEIEISKEDNGYLFSYRTQFQVFERINFTSRWSRNINGEVTRIRFLVPFDLDDGEKVEVSADRTNDWSVLEDE